MKDLRLLKSLKKKKQSDIALARGLNQLKNDSSLPPVQIRRGSNLPPNSRHDPRDNSHELESHITEDLSQFDGMKSEKSPGGFNKYGVYSQMSKEDMASIAEDIQI
mmetsp:Transcript_32056/g.49037  ORF Transcript_32056/g.49037 Transcript_32056/m.49037 type:complete len:106 (+) Transcript_32056:1062-1379(+)|eukprot:CAMPEP_0170511122 /NCGR_PEP_ID=MMETSP0208-20121228/66131_1 /TAXON_ID=197538 /ORGANISM="Strombidium inclinatum, Strain S3" /LENGTH=105 /DNA_ID=CAMNT_0010794629 /DNA_START=2550 /DNA_END=2867 /DNA_ORIENTATION=-